MAAIEQVLADVRSLSAGLRSGDGAALRCWRQLANTLLHATVAGATEGVRLDFLAGRSGTRTQAKLTAHNGRAVKLLDGRFLRVWQTLKIVETDDGPRVKVLQSSYQYQRDRVGDDWLFRYDYERYPKNHYPGAHLQVRAEPRDSDWLPPKSPLERIHFPTDRVSLEAVLRLLVEDFGVPPARPQAEWRAVLAESERMFREIRHPPSPGPSA